MMRARNLVIRTTGLGLALAAALALGAGPLLAQCHTMYGSPRECTPSEEFHQCVNNAEDAFAQCESSRSRTYFNKVGCSLSWAIDRGSCSVDLVRNFLL